MDETIMVVPLEYILWVASGFGLPLLGWGISMTWNVLRIKEVTRDLLTMHRNPDEHGFGTVQTNETLAKSHRELISCIGRNTQVVEELIHYVKWSSKERTGKELPPPLGEIDNG